MRQQSIDVQNEFQPAFTEEPFFEEETVQTIPAVVPLDETPTRTSARRFRQLRVPMRKADNSFNPAFLIMALVAVTALGVIAGTLLYRTASENRVNSAVSETGETNNRIVPAQYQFVVDKPESTGATRDNLPKDNLPSDNFTGTLPSTSTTEKKDSRENQESSAPDAENEEQPAEKEEVVKEETEAGVSSDELEEPPPPPPMRRDRKAEKKQEKAKQKPDNAKSETKDEEPPSEERNEGNESSEN